MFEIGQRVIVITENAITFDATVVGRAKGDEGPGAYKVVPQGQGPGQLGQWHKANEVFIAEQTEAERKDSWDSWLKE
jgi:hypothetical protein